MPKSKPLLLLFASLLFLKEQQEQFALGKERIAFSLFYSQNMSDSHEKPTGKLQTLVRLHFLVFKKVWWVGFDSWPGTSPKGRQILMLLYSTNKGAKLKASVGPVQKERDLILVSFS